MGYYQGSGVVQSMRANTNCIYSQWEPGVFIDGVPYFWHLAQVFRTFTETVTVKNGVAKPYTVSSNATADNMGAITSSTSESATRIGDSNLFSLTTTDVTSVTA